MIVDNYNSIQKPSEGIFKDKGSRFLAFILPVSSEEQVKDNLTAIKKKYHDARHHCYAYKIGVGDDRYRINDDGEPSGTAGKPIFGQILSNDLSDVLIVVVRYFGGVKLGTSGLINAYKNAALEAIKSAQVIKCLVKKPLELKFTYELMSAVMRIVKEDNIEVLEQDFQESCRLILNIRESKYEAFGTRFKNIYGVLVADA